MAITTYDTSEKNGLLAGMLTVTANSYPTLVMIDGFREDAYGLIYEIIQTDASGLTAQQLRIAKKWEHFLTKIMIDNVRYKTNIIPSIPPQGREELTSTMGIIPIEVFEPGKDT